MRDDTLTGGVDSTILIDDATHDKGDKYFVVVTRGIDGFVGTINYFIKGTNNGVFGEPTVDISFIGDNSGCLGSTFNVSSTITGDVGDNVTYQRTNDAGILDAWPQLEVDAESFSITPSAVFDIEVDGGIDFDGGEGSESVVFGLTSARCQSYDRSGLA